MIIDVSDEESKCMKGKRSKLLGIGIVSIIICALSALSFYTGVEWGVRQWLHLTSPVEAMFDVRVLQALRTGDVKTALQIEDFRLNLRVAEHWKYQPGWDYVLWTGDMRTLEAQLPKAGELILKYRKQYSSDIADDASPDFIDLNADVNRGLLLLEKRTESERGGENKRDEKE